MSDSEQDGFRVLRAHTAAGLQDSPPSRHRLFDGLHHRRLIVERIGDFFVRNVNLLLHHCFQGEPPTTHNACNEAKTHKTIGVSPSVRHHGDTNVHIIVNTFLVCVPHLMRSGDSYDGFKRLDTANKDGKRTSTPPPKKEMQ